MRHRAGWIRTLIKDVFHIARHKVLRKEHYDIRSAPGRHLTANSRKRDGQI